MKKLIIISIFSLFIFSCDDLINEPEDLTYYDLYCSEGYVELWGNYYNIETTTELNSGNNMLTGIIPSHIGCLTNLTYLYLTDTQLTGEIPPEIGYLTNLTYLNLYNNQLSGEIPQEVCDLYVNWSNINIFRIYNNQLCPPYPQCIEVYVGEQDTTNCP